MPSLGEPATTQQLVFSIVEGYAYNAYEVCRIMNGIDAEDFQPCFSNRLEMSDRCNLKNRGCKVRSNTVDRTLRALQKRGLLSSIKLRWFDKGRGKNKDGLCTDLFRFYFVKKRHLAERLLTDISTHLLSDGDCILSIARAET